MMVYAIMQSVEREDGYGISYNHDIRWGLGVFESWRDVHQIASDHNDPIIQEMADIHRRTHRQACAAESRRVAEHNALEVAGLRSGRAVCLLSVECPAFEEPEEYDGRYDVVGLVVKPTSNPS